LVGTFVIATRLSAIDDPCRIQWLRLGLVGLHEAKFVSNPFLPFWASPLLAKRCVYAMFTIVSYELVRVGVETPMVH
jgi:hypothetical protein